MSNRYDITEDFDKIYSVCSDAFKTLSTEDAARFTTITILKSIGVEFDEVTIDEIVAEFMKKRTEENKQALHDLLDGIRKLIGDIFERLSAMQEKASFFTDDMKEKSISARNI